MVGWMMVAVPSGLRASDQLSSGWVSDGEWRTTIRLLEERGLAECNLTPRQRRHAAQHGNMGYRYKRGPRAHEV
jgi:hypothetical protein